MRLSGTFAAKMHVWLGKFHTVHEAARAYEAATWRFNRSFLGLNFLEYESQDETEMLAPPPLLVTRKDQR
jgi:hypothetical protein